MPRLHEQGGAAQFEVTSHNLKGSKDKTKARTNMKNVRRDVKKLKGARKHEAVEDCQAGAVTPARRTRADVAVRGGTLCH